MAIHPTLETVGFLAKISMRMINSIGDERGKISELLITNQKELTYV